MLSQMLFLTLLPLNTFAHFTLDSPTSRPLDEDTLAQFPCGGQDTPSSNRTQWSLTGGPIQLTMGHDEAAVQVLLGLGNDPGVNFNITLLPTIQEQGLGQFCVGDVRVPDGVATEGMNATIQVVTNGDPTGGLYNVSLSFRPFLRAKPTLAFLRRSALEQRHTTKCSSNPDLPLFFYRQCCNSANR